MGTGASTQRAACSGELLPVLGRVPTRSCTESPLSSQLLDFLCKPPCGPGTLTGDGLATSTSTHLFSQCMATPPAAGHLSPLPALQGLPSAYPATPGQLQLSHTANFLLSSGLNHTFSNELCTPFQLVPPWVLSISPTVPYDSLTSYNYSFITVNNDFY